MWRRETSVNILELTLAVWAFEYQYWINQINIYINTFPNAVTSEKAQNHEISM